MVDDVASDLRVHVERKILAKMDEVKEFLSGVLSCCAKETSLREESDTVKILSGIEMRFREKHVVLVEAISAHTLATKA